MWTSYDTLGYDKLGSVLVVLVETTGPHTCVIQHPCTIQVLISFEVKHLLENFILSFLMCRISRTLCLLTIAWPDACDLATPETNLRMEILQVTKAKNLMILQTVWSEALRVLLEYKWMNQHLPLSRTPLRAHKLSSLWYSKDNCHKLTSPGLITLLLKAQHSPIVNIKASPREKFTDTWGEFFTFWPLCILLFVCVPMCELIWMAYSKHSINIAMSDL